MPADSKSVVLTDNFRALSLFRLAFAACLLFEFLAEDRFYLADFYSTNGIMPLSARSVTDRELPFVLPLLQFLEADRNIAFVQLAYPLALLGFLAGCWTRLCAGMALAIKSYLVARTPSVSSGIDDLSCLLLLWGLFLPLSRYCSMDALGDGERRRPWPYVPFLAMGVQISSLYVFAALFKLQGAPWRHGVAVAWAMSDSAFGSTGPGLVVLEYLPGLVPLATYGVIALQLSHPLLVYCPWNNALTRGAALAGAAALHISFVFFLNVGLFPFLCLAMLLLLVPDPWIERLMGAPAAGILRRVAAKVGDAAAVLHGRLQCAVRNPRTAPRQAGVPQGAVLLCLALLVLAFVSNVATLCAGWLGRFPLLDRVTAAAQVQQGWALFAPVPVHFRRSYDFRAVLADGSAVDAMALLPAPLARTRADGTSDEFAASRWRRYLAHHRDFSDRQWTALGAYLCRQVEAARPDPGRRPRSIVMTLSIEPLPEAEAEPREVFERTHACSEAGPPGVASTGPQTYTRAAARGWSAFRDPGADIDAVVSET